MQNIRGQPYRADKFSDMRLNHLQAHLAPDKNFAGLLDYAVRLIILRRVGDGYICVHRYLMEYFAGPDSY